MQYTVKKSLARGFILFSLALSVLSLSYLEASAQEANANAPVTGGSVSHIAARPVVRPSPIAPVPCGLTFCDVNASLAAARTSTPAARHEQMLATLMIVYRDQNPLNLSAIRDWAVGMKALTTELQDEAWLQNEARTLVNAASLRIALYAEPNAITLMDHLRVLPFDSDRRQVYDHWIARLDQIEERAVLLQLTQFFSAAILFSIEKEDDDYIIQLAKNGEQKAATKLFRLQPLIEGVYEARLTCVAQTDQSVCPSRLVDKLIIYDSLSPLEGIVAQFVSTRLGTAIDRFSLLTPGNGGTTFEAAVTGNRVARLHLDVDLVTKEISGEIQTTENLIRVHAVPLRDARRNLTAAPITIFDERHGALLTTPIDTALFEQQATGTFGSIAARLRIQLFDAETVGATMTLGADESQALHFGLGRYYPQHGIFTFISDSIRGGVLKLTIALVPTPTGYRVYGFTFNTNNGTVRQVAMEFNSSGRRVEGAIWGRQK